jgi:hypothetical protein
LDAYLEEELIDLFTHNIQNPNSSELESKKQRITNIGREIYEDGGQDAMENMFYSVAIRIKEEIGIDINKDRSWWNGITDGWNY